MSVFSDEDLKEAKERIVKEPYGEFRCFEIAPLIARVEAAESALDSYDRLYHAYDDESLDEYKRWQKVSGKDNPQEATGK